MRRLLWLALGVVACGGAPAASSPAERAEQLAEGCLEEGRDTCMDAAAFYASQSPTPETNQRLSALYYRACLGGQSRACASAAGMFERGEVQPPDRRRARAMFEHVCRNRFPFDPGACTAGALYGRACEGGHGSACASLAALHSSGRLGRRRPDLSRQLYRRACSSGHAASCAMVATDLARTDPAAAAKLLHAGCQAGDIGQCVALADLLHRGVGLPRDLGRARQLRQRACEAKHGGACFALAGMWRKGLGGSPSKENARVTYTSACELDDADACLALARAHAVGEFGEADMAAHYELSGKAAKIYAPACEAGDAHACHVLGALHRQGGGVRSDRTLGLSLQKRACAAGHGPACIAFLKRGPHRISIKDSPKLAHAVAASCRDGDGGACFAVGWIGRNDLEAAGAKPPAHPYSRGCRAGHAPSCNALGIASFPPSAPGVAALGSACELGYAPGCHHLGVAKEMQSDVEADEHAVTAYARACGLGWSAACTRLGLMRRQGHVTPGAMPARKAFERGCDGGDAIGCYELGLVMRGQSGGDVKVGMRLLERACKKGHVVSCAEIGEHLLRSVPERRAEALTKLGEACTAGGSRACVVLADALGDDDASKRKTLLSQAIESATASCNDGLAVCGGTEASRSVSLGWGSYEGMPARELGHPPACGIALERACVVVRDAHVKMCELTGSGHRCFEAGKEIRRLSAAGLSIGAADAKRMEELGLKSAEKGCRKSNAAACAAVAESYRTGRGTEIDERKAKQFDTRACQLDKTRCP